MSNLYTVSNVNVGTYPNDSQGDPLRTAFIKINQNFANVFTYANLAYYNGVGNGGGGGGSSNVIFEGWSNITTTNLAILTSKLAKVSPTNLSDLANALSNVSTVNLGALNNALATVNVTALTNFTNVFNSITANATSGTQVGLVGNLSANGTANGQAVYNTTDGGLYIWKGNAWISPGAAFTPTANSISGVEIFTTFSLATGPGDGRDFNGRQGFYNGNLYIKTSGAWSSYNSFITGSGTPVLSSGIITATELAAGSVIAGKIGAAAISAAEIQANAITASLIASNAIIAGKIAAGVISAVEIAANAITATAIAANSIYTLALQAGAVTANTIAANAVTAVQIAANAVYANAIQSNSIETRMLRANIITAVELAANSVYAGALMANVITANEIAANAITAVELAANAVYAGSIMAYAITADKIAVNAITAVHIGANTINAGMIDTRGLTIKDNNGNILLAAGTGLLTANIQLSSSTIVQTPGGNQTLGTLTANATPKWIDLRNSHEGFLVTSTGTYYNTSNILLTANLSGMTGTATFAVTAGTATLTATSDPNAKRLYFANALTDTIGITATFAYLGTTYTDTVNLYKSYQGNTTPQMFLTDEVRALPCDPSGTVASYTDVVTTATIYEGLNEVTSQFTFTTAATGCTITGANTRTANVTNMSANTASVVFTAVRTKDGATVTKTYRLTKAYSGAAGTPGSPGGKGDAGTRGSQTFVRGVAGLSAWNDAQADTAISSAGLTKVARDTVTLFNSTTPSSFSEARFWDGSAWSAIAAYINGGLLVNGTISATKLVADSITSAQIAAGAITADEIQAGTITLDKLKASSATIASGYRFSLGQGGSVPVGATTANGVILAVSTAYPVFAGLFESKNGSPALVAATPVISAAYNRDASYARYGSEWECEPIVGYRGRDSNYTQTPNKTAILAHGNAGLISTSYARADSLTFATGNGKHPPDQNVNLTPDLSNGTTTTGPFANVIPTYGNTTTTDKSAAGTFSTFSRNPARWARSRALNSNGIPLTLQSYINHSEGTGAVGTTNSSGVGSPDNFGAQFTSYACDTAGYSSSIDNFTTASIRFAQDLSYTGSATGRAIWVFKGSSVWEAGCQIIVNGTVLAFTGSHNGLYDKNEEIEVGDIVIDTPTVIHGNIDNNLTVVTKSNAPMQKSVIGVYGRDTKNIPYPIKNPTTIVHSNVMVGTSMQPVENYSSTETVKEEYAELYSNNKLCDINALGEGLINVCGENGNVEIGDYITTSSIPGKGMKQDDDLMRNYTVAKSRENVTFSSPTEVKMIACTYHCG